MSGLWGELGAAAGISTLWSEFNQRSVQAREFGWYHDGIGGNWSIEGFYVPYVPSGRAAVNTGVFRDSPEATMFQVGANFKTAGDPEVCMQNQTYNWFLEHYLFPKWFFDWGKEYLYKLRQNQPSFDAPVEEKLIWTTHVAWTINMMLGSTNLHGSVLSMALMWEATGLGPTVWGQNGSYMFPSIHVNGFEPYWQEAVNEAITSLYQGGGTPPPSNAVFDYGDKVYDTEQNPIGESFWMGSPWATPFETKRLRWATPSWVANDCPASGACTPVVKPIEGLTYGFGSVNDPFFVSDGMGNPSYDGGRTVEKHARWSYAVPWVMGVQTWGNPDPAKWGGSGNSLLETAVRMSTFFAEDRGDADFWNALNGWRADPSPRFKASGTWAQSGRQRYSPNREFAFRYYYPAMIDMLNRCDYASFVSRGLNLWWRYNVGALDTNIAFWSAGPTNTRFAPDGSIARGQNGDPLMPAIAPPGTPEAAKWDWLQAKDEAHGFSILVNFVRTIIAVVMAVFGQYGSLVGAVKGWYEHFSEEFPRADDYWLGIVPPTPVVMRMSPLTLYQGPGRSPAYVTQPGPDVIGGGNFTGNISFLNHGGQTVGEMIGGVRSAIQEWSNFGGPVIPSSDVINQLAIRSPSVAGSPAYPQLPPPGTVGAEMAAPIIEWSAPEGESAYGRTYLPPAPPLPPPRKAGVGIWLVGTVAAVGAFTAYRFKRKKRAA